MGTATRSNFDDGSKMGIYLSLIECANCASRKDRSSSRARAAKWISLIESARICSKDPALQAVARSGAKRMASIARLNPYRCDQCGTPDIVAAPILYQQGTRTYSSMFSTGTSQSHFAQTVSPPNPRGYGRPFLLWGIPICFTFFWGVVGLDRILGHPSSMRTLGNPVAILLLLGIACVGGMFLNFRRINLYNREIYPGLLWIWEHTYVCRRCGKVLFVT
jgi:hypothetical protein